MTMGTKIRATTSMIFRVSGLDAALATVALAAASILEGRRFGYRPITPKRVAATMVRLDAHQAFHQAARPKRVGNEACGGFKKSEGARVGAYPLCLRELYLVRRVCMMDSSGRVGPG